MLKFWLASRPRDDGMSREQFDYEWSYIHVALMITTPIVMKSFQRYTQNRTPDGVTDDLLMYGRHPENWYMISDHWLDGLEDLQAIFAGEEYPRRMQAHAFGSKHFTIELTAGEVLYDQPVPFTGRGGVKLVNFLARADDVDQETFAAQWPETTGAAMVRYAKDTGVLKRYVQNPQLSCDAAMFKGSLFELGGVQTYAGIEELWFPDLDGLRRFREGSAINDELASLGDGFIDPVRSFSMVVVERVVWDFTADTPSPRPAVENSDSLEAAILRQEQPWGEWNVIRPAHD